ncbi:MAG: SpoIIE family protein phosphatase [Chloroflexi bacterium]|nr:SpoIIE family protein phosphatase [Chloroflexota bacterium]
MTNLLARIPLFADLPEAELDQLIAMLKVVELKPRDVLFREGDVGEHFYVIADGELEILRAAGQPEELLLNVIGEGQYLGEMSLIMPGGQRTADVRARTTVTLLVMSRAEFDDLLRRFPLLAYSMVRVSSERLDNTNTSTFRDLTEKNRQLQKAYDELKAAQEQLIEKERLERELQVAAEIQVSILPDVLPTHPNYDFGARIDPARQVGGDFYDVFPVGENKIGVLIGDVADKGVPSAIFMARIHALIMAESDALPTAALVLRKVNEHVTRLEKVTQFVTALYGILDCATGDFDYARAGHEPPLLLTADGVQRLPHGPGMALGIWEDITLDVGRVRLTPGASLLLFTDGMTDCRDPQGEAFGLERIEESFLALRGLPSQEVCDRLLKTLLDYQHGSNQDDDVTLVAIHAK